MKKKSQILDFQDFLLLKKIRLARGFAAVSLNFVPHTAIDSNNHSRKNERVSICENIKKCLLCYFEFRQAYWTTDAILNLTKNLFFCEICPTKIQAQIKTERLKCSKLTELWLKNQFFSHFACGKNFQFLLATYGI
jgi:hypothetical protein